MSELAIFSAELERLEREGRWDDPGYDYLASKVEELQAAEKARRQPAQAPAAGQPQEDLAGRMQAMSASPWKFTDEQIAATVAEYNQAVIAAGESQPEAVDFQALQRDMLQAGANPAALSDEQRVDLLRRFNHAQRPAARSSAELRAALEGNDLVAGMEAALQLQQRGELPDEQATALVDAYNTEVRAAAERGLNVEELPEELRPAAEAILKAAADLEIPADPVDAALHQLNTAIRSMRPATLTEQLEALGVSAEPAGAEGDE